MEETVVVVPTGAERKKRQRVPVEMNRSTAHTGEAVRKFWS